MSYEISTRFAAGTAIVDADFVMFAKSGRLSIAINGREVSCIEWMDWSDEFRTEEGLQTAALREIGTLLAAAEAEDETPEDVKALLAAATGR